MNGVPRPALFLGLAGVLPFCWGVLTMQFDVLSKFRITLCWTLCAAILRCRDFIFHVWSFVGLLHKYER